MYRIFSKTEILVMKRFHYWGLDSPGSPQLVLRGVSPPVLNLPYLHLHCCCTMKVSRSNLYLNLSGISTFLSIRRSWNIMLVVSELYRTNLYNCDDKMKLDIVLAQTHSCYLLKHFRLIFHNPKFQHHSISQLLSLYTLFPNNTADKMQETCKENLALVYWSLIFPKTHEDMCH